jgi:hypothetical protein
MTTPARFPYVAMQSALRGASQMPMLPLTLAGDVTQQSVTALLDTGSPVNVLPHSVGLALGGVWDNQRANLRLTGGLAGVAAMAFVLTAKVGSFSPVRLAFAWAQDDSTPIILGQTNFFAEFDVCFFRSQLEFEIRPKQ